MHHKMDFVVCNYTSKEELRKTIILKFLAEKPSLDKGDNTSHYRDNVETLSDDKRIYLHDRLI
jgi:hypothetical protein